MRSKLHSVVDEDDVKSSQRRSMTLVIDLEQRFQVSLRSIGDLTTVVGARRRTGVSRGLNRERI